jgi:hypothetical protein
MCGHSLRLAGKVIPVTYAPQYCRSRSNGNEPLISVRSEGRFNLRKSDFQMEGVRRGYTIRWAAEPARQSHISRPTNRGFAILDSISPALQFSQSLHFRKCRNAGIKPTHSWNKLTASSPGLVRL